MLGPLFNRVADADISGAVHTGLLREGNGNPTNGKGRTVKFRTCSSALVAAVGAIALLVFAPAALAANDTTQFSVTAGSLSLGTAPDVPNLPALTLNGQSQTLTAQMANFSAIDATGAATGWNVTVIGDTSGGKSAVFKEYCPNATCGSNSGPGYVSGGATLGPRKRGRGRSPSGPSGAS